MTLSPIVSRFIRPAMSVISPENHAGYLWIVTILGLIYTILVAFARVYVKIRMFGVDDLILGLATVNPSVPRVRLINSNSFTDYKI